MKIKRVGKFFLITSTFVILGFSGMEQVQGAVEIDQTAARRSDTESSPQLIPKLPKGPYLIYPGNNTEMMVLWQLDDTQTCLLEWGDDLTYSEGFVQTVEFGSDHQHKYTITKLIPGDKYYYRVVDGKGQAHSGNFIAAPLGYSSSLKMLGYGDTRSYPDTHDAVCAKMVRAYQADSAMQTLLLHAGDWTSNDSEETWATEYFSASSSNARELQAHVAISGCKGNHEKKGIYYEKYWPYPYVRPSHFYWSFDYGPVHVTVINQDIDYSPGSAQYQWIENDLATETKKWKILLFHKPAWSAGGHPNDTAAQTYIHPLSVNYGVAIAFSGHNHYYSRCEVDGVQYITSGGGGTTLHTPYPDYPYVKVCESSHHYWEIDIQGNQLYFRAVDINGSQIDSFTLVKSVIYVNKDDDSCGGNTPCFTSIQSAINAAITGTLLQVAQGTYTESIVLSSSKSLTLKGGWNSAFNSQTSNTTFVKQPRATQGSLTLQVISMKP